tara:strand:- start:1400 stop:2398 length:999 start_codon:yes stop_codon:yes gene_type:complete
MQAYKEGEFKKLALQGRVSIEAFEEPQKFKIDRSKYMNASEADTCIRKQWYSKHAPEAGEKQSWGFARRGTHMEKYIVESLRAGSVSLSYAGDSQESIVDEESRISGTPDGILEFKNGYYGFEFKSIDPRTNIDRLPRSNHVTQLKLGMALINKTLNMEIKQGLLIYMDASDYDKIHEFIIPVEAGIIERLTPRAAQILDTKDVAQLDREGKTSGGKECNYCSFREVCLQGPINTNKEVTDEKLNSMVQRMMELKSTEYDIKEEKVGLTERIKQSVLGRGVHELIVGAAYVVVKTIKGRSTLDRKAVAQAGIDLSAFEKTAAPTERLEIKQV